jgi:hypothetical protein
MRTARLGACAGIGPVVVLLFAACSPSPSVVPTPQGVVQTQTASSAPTPLPSVAAGLPELGLANVATDAAAARSAIIGPAGGSISATSANGAVYTLTFPADALPVETAVGVYPVTRVTAGAVDAAVSAGVQFTPDGLRLTVPAQLTIDLPAGVVGSGLHAIGWQGDGQLVHRVAATADGQRYVLPIFHFSGAGLTPEDLALAFGCADASDYPCLQAEFEHQINQANITRSAYLFLLRSWYRAVIEPELRGSIAEASNQPDAAHVIDERIVASDYTTWRSYAVDIGPLLFPSPPFTVAPELSDSARLAAVFLFDWYIARNNLCIQHSNDPAARPILDADEILESARVLASGWAVATAANRLDAEYLLDHLCVQLVIEAGSTYSATLPAQQGTVHVVVGYRVGAGPIQRGGVDCPAGDCPVISVDLTVGGAGAPFAEGFADASGVFEAGLTWPAAADPIRIHIHGRLSEAGAPSRPVPGEIVRDEQITKAATRFSFTFDSGFDTWSHGTVGARGSHPSNWGLAAHLSSYRGVIQLDGRGTPSRPNAWIDRAFDLPSTVSTMTIRVSPEIYAGTSSIVQVRVVEPG